MGFWLQDRRRQAEYVRIPFADQALTPIPDEVTDEQALFTGDLLSTGYWAAKIGEIQKGDTVLVIGAGPAGLCTMMCAASMNLQSSQRRILNGKGWILLRGKGLPENFIIRKRYLWKKR